MSDIDVKPTAEWFSYFYSIQLLLTRHSFNFLEGYANKFLPKLLKIMQLYDHFKQELFDKYSAKYVIEKCLKYTRAQNVCQG